MQSTVKSRLAYVFPARFNYRPEDIAVLLSEAGVDVSLSPTRENMVWDTPSSGYSSLIVMITSSMRSKPSFRKSKMAIDSYFSVSFICR